MLIMKIFISRTNVLETYLIGTLCLLQFVLLPTNTIFSNIIIYAILILVRLDLYFKTPFLPIIIIIIDITSNRSRKSIVTKEWVHRIASEVRGQYIWLQNISRTRRNLSKYILIDIEDSGCIFSLWPTSCAGQCLLKHKQKSVGILLRLTSVHCSGGYVPSEKNVCFAFPLLFLRRNIVQFILYQSLTIYPVSLQLIIHSKRSIFHTWHK